MSRRVPIEKRAVGAPFGAVFRLVHLAQERTLLPAPVPKPAPDPLWSPKRNVTCNLHASFSYLNGQATTSLAQGCTSTNQASTSSRRHSQISHNGMGLESFP